MAKPLYSLPKKSSAGLKRKAIAVYLALAFSSFSIGTQYIAHEFDYDVALGEPVIGKIYAPYEVVHWGFEFFNYPELRETISIGGFIALSGTVLSAFFSYILLIRLQRKFDEAGSELKGSSKWATVEMAKEEGLIGEASEGGVYIGSIEDQKGNVHYLRDNRPTHVIAFQPTRSGKGVGLVLPTMLSWRYSAFIHDIKGENWALTSGYRKSIGQKVIKLDPTCIDGSGAKFNPLEEIRLRSLHEVKDVQNVLKIVVDSGGDEKLNHWESTASDLLLGVIIHIMYLEEDKSLAGAAAFLSNPARTFEETLEYMLQAQHIDFGEESSVYWDGKDPLTGEPTLTHPIVAQSVRTVMNKEEKERSGVLSTAMTFLQLYRDPIIASNSSKSDFKIRDLQLKDQPVSLYFIVSPSDKDRLRPFVRLVVTQILRQLAETMRFEGGRSVEPEQKLLLMMDEFISLGRLDVFAENLAFLAGYGIKAYLIIQDLAQLYKLYTKDEEIMGNCETRIASAPNKIETAELLSKMVGVSTVQAEQNSYSGGRSAMVLGNMSSSIQEVERSLLTLDECLRLPSTHSLIFIAGKDPIYGPKIVHYKDQEFSRRSKIPAPVVSDKTFERMATSSIKKPNLIKAQSKLIPETEVVVPAFEPDPLAATVKVSMLSLAKQAKGMF